MKEKFNWKVRETGRRKLIMIGETNKRDWKAVRFKERRT